MDLHTDPFIIAARANIMALEDAKNEAHTAAVAQPRDAALQVAYDAAVVRLELAEAAYRAQIRTIIEGA